MARLPFVPRDQLPAPRGERYRVRHIKSGSNYCDRRNGLILPTCLRAWVYRACEFLVFLSVSPHLASPGVLPDPAQLYRLIRMQPAPFSTFGSSSTKYCRLRCCRKEESCRPPVLSFARTSDHLSKLPLLLCLPHSLYSLCLPASPHTRHLLGIRSVPVGQSCNPHGSYWIRFDPLAVPPPPAVTPASVSS